jgi:O-antigen/teichoic acid export membrane protein
MSIDRPAAATELDTFASRLCYRLVALRATFAERRLELSAVAIFLMRVASAALLFLVQILLARWLGAAEYGVYAALWTTVLVAGGLSHLGLSMAAIRLVPQYTAEKSSGLLRGFLIGARAAPFAIAGALALVMMALLAAFPALAPNGHWWPAVLALACLPAFAVTEVQDGIGRGQGWTSAALAPPYILRPALLFLATAIGVAMAAPATATSAMIGAALATWGTVIVQSALIQRRIGGSLEPATPSYDFRAWMGVAMPLLAVGGCELILQNADVLVLSWMRPSAEVGIYYAAAKTQAIAMFVHYAVGSAIAGRIAAAKAQDDRRELDDLVMQAARWTFWPTLAVVAVLLVLGVPLLSLFGGAFVDAYPVMLIAAIGIMTRAAAGPADYILNMLGHQKDCARAFMIAAGVAIGGNLLLVPWFGMVGAAAATSTAFATAAVLNALTLRRVIGIDPFATLLPASLRAPATSASTVSAPGSSLAATAVRTRDGIAAIAREWTDLIARSSGPVQPFLQESWNRHWLQAYCGEADEPTVITIRRDGRLVLVWPLCLHRSRGGVLAMWMGAPVSQYGDLIVEAGGDVQSPDHASGMRNSWATVV